MKASNSKSRTEIILWFLFLSVCAGLGYIQGLKPDLKPREIISETPEIEILTVSEDILPEYLIKSIEQETHSKISVTKIKSWQELKVKLIADPAADLVFIPSHWIQNIVHENLISESFFITPDFVDAVSPEFLIEYEYEPRKLKGFLPVFWTQLHYYQKHQPAQNYSSLNDADYFIKIAQQIKDPKSKISFSDKTLFLLSWDQIIREENKNYDIAPLTHLQKKDLATLETSRVLFLLGFSIPKNSRYKQLSQKIIHYYIQYESQEPLIHKLPFASTLVSLDTAQIPEIQKSSYIRKIELKQQTFLKAKNENLLDKATEMTGVTFEQ